MKKVIPFSKEINFKTMISKITNLSLEHTLRVNDDNTISGDFIVEGRYKMTQASQIDEGFSYKIPLDISIDDKYSTDNVLIDIEDFKYEIIDEEKLLLNISLSIDNLEEKKELENNIIIEDSIYEDVNKKEDVREEVLDDLFLDTSSMEKLEIPKDEPGIDTNNSNNVDSLISVLSDQTEPFITYSVYMVKEEDTVETILEKYNITKEELEEYNSLSDIKIGSKVLIPNVKDE